MISDLARENSNKGWRELCTQRRIDECNSHPIMRPLNTDVRLATEISLATDAVGDKG